MKLNFIHHLQRLPESQLAKRIYNRQVSEGLPDLIQENLHHLEQLNFEQTKYLSKWKFRKLGKEFVKKLCREELLEESKKYNEEFKRKDYMNHLNR